MGMGWNWVLIIIIYIFGATALPIGEPPPFSLYFISELDIVEFFFLKLAIGAIIGGLIWMLPNYIYWKK